MTIKDQLTDEELLCNSFPHVPDDGRDHTRCHLDRLHAAQRARRKAPFLPAPVPEKQGA